MIREQEPNKGHDKGEVEGIDYLLLAHHASASKTVQPPFPRNQLPRNLSDLFNREEDRILLLGGTSCPCPIKDR
jgi:hypothetical protein